MFGADHRFQTPQKQRIKVRHVLRTLLICTVIAVIFSVQIYRFGGVFKYWWSNRELKQRYVLEVNELQQKQENMKLELYKLKNNKLTQERLAREMGYARPGEIVYKFVNVNQDSEVEK
jgi:cell division protein FtsB